VATLLTLLFLPALYVAWYKIREPQKHNWSPGTDPVGAGLPANAMVEPPPHSRVNPLPQGLLSRSNWSFDFGYINILKQYF